ncbi:MAG: RNB domain-containing ribonuclease [Desulfovibrio sp.]|jgi:ribonuclease R|nr:RNB domain-containing ribonuclease [Desulfovibrio sp.]
MSRKKNTDTYSDASSDKSSRPKPTDIDRVQGFERQVKRYHRVPCKFTAATERDAAALPAEVTADDMRGREDMRDIPFVTIDGADARDFDDAIHVERTGERQWLLRVAIADVSHYVSPDTTKALDAEALVRGNSQYFPLSVEPMLPEALSNGLCSLVPWQDRLAVVAEFSISADAPPGKPRFALAVIHSHARLTYDQVKACMLDRNPAQLEEMTSRPSGMAVAGMLEEAFNVFRVLQEARSARGSMDFDHGEPVFQVKKDGEGFSYATRQRHDAHRLIEECMIAANEAVARHLEASGAPCIYRVHPEPEPERLKELFDTLKYGSLSVSNKLPSKPTLAGILALAKGAHDEDIVARCCLRAMPKAYYDVRNIGHYGLASESYCHFTSPIRRYADLAVHRALRQSMGWPIPKKLDFGKFANVANIVNVREIVSVDAEREMGKMLGCLVLSRLEGRTVTATVTGLAEFGLFMAIDGIPEMEGLLHVSKLPSNVSPKAQRDQEAYDRWRDGDFDDYDDFYDDYSRYGRRHSYQRNYVEPWMLGVRGRVKIEYVDIHAQRVSLIPDGSFKGALTQAANNAIKA